MLYLYVQDNGWEGGIVVVASSEEEARKRLENSSSLRSYNENKELEVLDIEDGLVFEFSGDV